MKILKSNSHEVNCINVLRKQVIIGTFAGQLLFYSTLNGQLMAEVNAHIRQINAIAVAPENAFVRFLFSHNSLKQINF